MFTLDGVNYRFTARLPDNAENSVQFFLVRLLLGTLELSNSSNKFRQNLNFSIVPPVEQTNSGGVALKNFLKNELGCTQNQFIKITIADNRNFYRQVLAEFSQYFLQSARGSHLAAFVFLYRILEKVSFSIPLLYSSTAKDFSKTFDDMKRFFSEGGAGELSFFKKFLDSGLLIDRNVMDTKLGIDLISVNGYRKNYFDALNKQFKNFEVADKSTYHFEISFHRLGDLLVVLRNRFLHQKSGDWRDNIAMTDICDPDEFYSQLNPLFCCYVATVVLQCVAKKYQI
jgi:hypothetical protein